MTEQRDPQVPEQQQPTSKRRVSSRAVIVLVVIAVFAGVVAAKYLPSVRTGGSSGKSRASATSVRNDAAADYQAAVKTGKPIYVLFHSLS